MLKINFLLLSKFALYYVLVCSMHLFYVMLVFFRLSLRFLFNLRFFLSLRFFLFDLRFFEMLCLSEKTFMTHLGFPFYSLIHLYRNNSEYEAHTLLLVRITWNDYSGTG